jgi:signal transduction histidine kinase/ActR/RegA family two-component response regulator
MVGAQEPERPGRFSGLWVWVSGLLGMALVLLVTLPVGEGPGLQDLQGVWTATIDGRPTSLELPGTFRAQGIDPDARVVARRTVQLPPTDRPWALVADNPQHALVVRWDGLEVGRFGDPERTGPGAARTDGAALVVFPADPDGGAHTLELDLRGDLRRGGLTGQILIGPVDQVLGRSQRDGSSRTGFALALALLAVVNLVGSMGQGPRLAQLLFGTFVLSLAGYSFEHSDHSLALVADPGTRFLIRRVCVAGMISLPVLFTERFVTGANSRPALAWAIVAAATAALSLVGGPVMIWMELVQDSMAIACIPWAAGLLGRGVTRGIPGSGWMLLGACFTAFGAVQEVMVTHGVVAGGRWLYPSLCLFLLFGTVAVTRHDRERSLRLDRLVRGSSDAMVELSPDGRVQDLNPAARAFLGQLVLGQGFLDVVPESARALVRAHLARSGSRANRCEFTLLDGRIVESLATPLDDRTRLLVLRDVTRRRRIDEGMLQAARVETAGILVGGLAHDFNNLLGALLGHAGLLRLVVSDPSAQERLSSMELAIERASLLARRLLALGGGRQGVPEEVPVRELLLEVVDLVRPTFPDAVAVHAELPLDLGDVRAVAEDLRHVIVNLLLNARDAVDGKGTVKLMARRLHAPRAVVIAIDDDGPGVPADLVERIWTPFFTTKGPKRGTGLGLPMARRVTREQGGRLWYEPRPGGGARFLLALHPTGGEVNRAPEHVRAARVAVVDDEETVRDAFRQALTDAGHSVTAWADGESALAGCLESPPDVLVTDVVMPGISGLELAAALREQHPGLPVVLVSGFVPDDEPAISDSGPWETLHKPVRASKVVHAVARLLAGGEAIGVEPGEDLDLLTGTCLDA